MDSPVNFVVPVHTADIELPAADRFHVQSVMDVGGAAQDDLAMVLQALKQKLSKDVLASLCDNSVFDPLYSLLRHFPSLNSKNKGRVMKIVCDAAASVVGRMGPSMDGSGEHRAQRLPQQVLNAYKAACFLLANAVMVGERNAGNTTSTKKSKAKKKKSTSLAAMQSSAEFAAWGELLPQCLQTLAMVLEINFSRVWPVGVAEEEFVALFTKAGLRVLERPQNTRSGSATRTSVVSMLARAVAKFPACTTSFAASIVHLLTTREHVAPTLAQIMKVLAREHNTTQLAGDVLRDVGRVNTNGVKDTRTVRNVASFLPTLAEHEPAAVLGNIAVLLPHLDGEAYSMRSALITAIGHVIAHEATTNATQAKALVTAPAGGDADDQDGQEHTARAATRTRDMLLDILQERVYDSNSYTRAATQRAFAMLVERGCLPLSRIQGVAALAADRLRDKAAGVRKAAMQLVCVLLECNPFGTTLDVSVYKTQLAAINEKLEALKPSSDGEDSASGGEEESKGVDSVERAHLRQQEFCTAAIKFAEQMNTSIPIIAQLMGSKIISDVLQAMDFLARARAFGLEAAESGLRKMLALVWSNEQTVKDKVIATFKELYIDVPGSKGRHHQSPMQVATNLVSLTVGSTLADRTSLEEVIRITARTGDLPNAVIGALWSMVEPEESNAPSLHAAHARSRVAMNVLAMVAAAKPDAVDNTKSFAVLRERVFDGDAKARRDYRLMAHACVALQHIKPLSGKSTARDARVETVLAQIEALITTVDDASRFWFTAAEKGINTLCTLNPRPEGILARIVRTLADHAFPQEGDATSTSTTTTTTKCPPSTLARLFFVLGHVAVKIVVHVEDLGQKLKKIQAAADNAAAARGESAQKETIEVELGLQAGEEEEQSEMLRDMEESQIVCRNLLGAFGPCIAQAVMQALASEQRHGAGAGGEVRKASPLTQASVLALCKFMCISSAFCESHLQLMFTVLAKASHPGLRCQVVVALGDLAFRFPNLVEPWIGRLYDRLADVDATVRKTTLMALSHLILNDMVKIRGHGAKVAQCLQDDEPRVRDFAQLFFHEFSKRGNSPIYNMLPDTLAALAQDDTVDQATFRDIMRFLLAFVKKDRHSDSLLDKLCHRFQTTASPRQWRGIMYCISQLKLTEKGAIRLAEGIRMYKQAITDPEVAAGMQAIITKAKKFTKSETQDLVAEWQNRFDAAVAGQLEDGAVVPRASHAPTTRRSTRTATPGGGDDAEERDVAAAAATTTRSTRARRKKAPARKKKQQRVVETSSDEEDGWSGGEGEEDADDAASLSSDAEEDSGSSDGESEVDDVDMDLTTGKENVVAAVRGKKASSSTTRRRGRAALRSVA